MDVLDPSALLETAVKTLPSRDGDAAGATADLRHPHDALALLLHAVMTRLDFRLQPEAASSDAQPNVLPVSWASTGPDNYTFKYKHSQSSLDFLVKLVSLSKRVLVHGIAVEDDRTATYDVPIEDFFSKSSFPWSRGDAEPLVHAFISSNRIKDLVGAYKMLIVQKLIPGLSKDGYQEEVDAGSSSSNPGNDNRRQDPAPAQPRPAQPPQGPDAHDPLRVPPRNPLIIGDRDLDPLGGARPFPGGGGGGGFGPPPLFGGPDNGGGMFVGPDHPMFRDRFGPGRGGGIGGPQGPAGPWGGDGYLPPGAVPPGARFDPVGPLGVPGPWPAGPGGRGRGGPRGPGGDPDWDDLRPPGNGYDSMFG